jgi:cytochrome c
MSFAGIAKAEQRAELLVYLRTLSDSPLPLPQPAAPAAAPPAEAPEGAGSEAHETEKAPG